MNIIKNQKKKENKMKYPKAFEEIAKTAVRDEGVFDFVEQVFSLEELTEQTLDRLEHKEGGDDIGPDQYFLEISCIVRSQKDYENLRKLLRKVLPQFKPDSVSGSGSKKQAKFRLHSHNIDEIVAKFEGGGNVDYHKGMEATYATRIYATLNIKKGK